MSNKIVQFEMLEKDKFIVDEFRNSIRAAYRSLIAKHSELEKKFERLKAHCFVIEEMVTDLNKKVAEIQERKGV